MISGVYPMRRQSERLRAHENEDIPLPTLANWQTIIASLEACVDRTEEDARVGRGQVPPPIPIVEVPPVQAPAVAPPVREAHREPLYKRFGKQHPPIFEGSTDRLKAKQWLDPLVPFLFLLSSRSRRLRTLPLLIIRVSALL